VARKRKPSPKKLSEFYTTPDKHPDRWKPEGFKDYLTVMELARFVDRNVSTIRRMDRDDRLPKPARVRHGRLMVRLYSPEQAEEVKAIFAAIKARMKRRKRRKR
jgi:hypothetical protein